jgi:hypothetical protein
MSDGPLQFDRAEYEQPSSSPSCERCERQLTQAYYQVNGQVVCPGCVEQLRAERTGGSRAGRVVRSVGAGFAAAVLGAVLYYAISAMTGYEFGLIAIVVGFGVGAAVRWGSNGRGGWAYQTLAIALTYLAIVGTYIPPIFSGLKNAQAASATSTQVSGASASDQAAPSDVRDAAPTAGQAMVAIILLLLLACAAPFLAGFQNVIGIIIIGIGLYEAWKLNRRTPFDVTGPHPVATTATGV